MKYKYVDLSIITGFFILVITGMLFTSYFDAYAQNNNSSPNVAIQNIKNETTLQQTAQEILQEIKDLTHQEKYDKLKDSCTQYVLEHEINQNSSFQEWNKVACDFYAKSTIRLLDLSLYQQNLSESIVPVTTSDITNKPVYNYSSAQNITNKVESTKNDDIANHPILNATSSQSKFLHYENPDYHLRVDYPSYLLKTESNLLPNQVVGFMHTESSYLPDVRILISVFNGYPQNWTLQDTAAFLDKQLNEQVQKGEARSISSNFTKIGGLDALQQIYYDYSNNNNLKIERIGIVKNGEDFRILFITQPGSFNNYISDFKKMLDSFEIIEFTPTNNTLTSESGLSYPSSSPSEPMESNAPFPNFKLSETPDFKLPDFKLPGL